MISGVIIISSPQWYPVRPVLESMAVVCAELIVNADTSNAETVPEIERILDEIDCPRKRVLKSPWDWTAKDQGQELARQTNMAIDLATKEWILDLQADELIHEDESARLLDYVADAPSDISGFKMDRLYFYQRPDILRIDWTQPLVRLFRKTSHVVVGDAMGTQTVWGRVVPALGCRIWHYSRIGDDHEIVERIHKLSTLYHEEDTLDLPKSYDWVTRKFDTFSSDNRHEAVEVDPDDVLFKWDVKHPIYILDYLRARGHDV